MTNSIKLQIKKLQAALLEEKIKEGKNRIKVRMAIMTGTISTPEIDALFEKLKDSEADHKLNEAIQRYHDGSATNTDYQTLTKAGYGYVDTATEFSEARFVWTGRDTSGNPYVNHNEGDMLGANDKQD